MVMKYVFVQPSIPNFYGYYDHWAMLMENFLRSKEYWSLIENGFYVAPIGTTSTKRKTILKDTSKDIWDYVKKKYQGSTRVKQAQLQALRKEFETLQMKTKEIVNDYFAQILTIANKMKANGELKSDTEIVEKNWGVDFNNSTHSELNWNDNASNTKVDVDDINEEDDGEVFVQQDEVVQQEETLEQLSPKQKHTQPSWMHDYIIGEELSDDDFESHIAINGGDDLVHFDEAEKNPIWRKAMQDEIDSIERNGTWFLTDLPSDAKKIGVKWIFKTKRDENGHVSKHKARFVVRGYT
ncbi:hypothetical protein GQ457_05G024780 [Hibiscus cannabinus]